MSFNDADLAELRGRLDPQGSQAVVGYSIDKWRALLARLDAAERCAEELLAAHHAHWREADCVKAWREASGKERP